MEMIVKCEKCGREYDFDSEPSGIGKNGEILCSRCRDTNEKIDTIIIRGSDSDAIFTNNEDVFRKWQKEHPNSCEQRKVRK